VKFMDRIVFGDNQFFGINHMSEEKAQTQLERFGDNREIIEVLDAAYGANVRGFMFSTHNRVRDICAHFRANISSYRGARFYPVLPYAHKYAAAVAEKGILGVAKDAFLTNNSAGSLIGSLTHGGVGMLRQDPFELMKVLVDAEMLMFRGLSLGVVFLQNIVADLLLGLRCGEAFVRFSEYVSKRYGAEAGFMTMNLPAMVDYLKECGLKNPIVCASVNKIGYLMNPDRASYERVIEDGGFRPVAMSILASGAVPPSEAIEYACSLKNIESFVFGASSKNNIVMTASLIGHARVADRPIQHPACLGGNDVFYDEAR
jgi:hypothetical protein